MLHFINMTYTQFIIFKKGFLLKNLHKTSNSHCQKRTFQNINTLFKLISPHYFPESLQGEPIFQSFYCQSQLFRKNRFTVLLLFSRKKAGREKMKADQIKIVNYKRIHFLVKQTHSYLVPISKISLQQKENTIITNV